ncbi:ribonuclease E inhibitor RraB [Microbacterium enclense]|uniref:ribonuclease E inhibitor RraB n=1 Tax=Microbacterium enclense TaxID=993073 RepID=UPI00204111AF|nr:ribonuclease E inhibitor RraB [Microbacterium enclense]MCM3613321.1 ribonuclease E inhibitor RraB [Microbacterium enclense]
MSSARKRPQLGDVFLIPVDETRAAVGQVVGIYRELSYYFAVFEDLVPIDAAAAAAHRASTTDITLLALSFDALLRNGDWRKVSVATVRADVPFPASKVSIGRPDHVVIEDHLGRLIRPVTVEEASRYPYRSTVAPIRVQKAARGINGFIPWDDEWDHMVPGRYPTVEQARAEEPAPTRPSHPAGTSSMPPSGAGEGTPFVNPALASELSSWILQEVHRRDLGENFSAPRPVDHTAYFRWRWSARRAAMQLAALGYSTTVEKHRREVVLKATREQTLEAASVRSFLEEVVNVVERNGGDYDGWGAPVEAAP